MAQKTHWKMKLKGTNELREVAKGNVIFADVSVYLLCNFLEQSWNNPI